MCIRDRSDALSRIFSPDPAVIAASARYLQCVMPPYVLFSTLFVLNSAMRGAGDSLYPMFNVVASVILLRVPFLYLLADRFGPDYMYSVSYTHLLAVLLAGCITLLALWCQPNACLLYTSGKDRTCRRIFPKGTACQAAVFCGIKSPPETKSPGGGYGRYGQGENQSTRPAVMMAME